jgi:hypothetical protein
MLNGIFEGCDQALILGEIVGLVAEILAEMGDLLPGLILNYYAITGRPRVAARAAVAVGDEVVLRRIFATRLLTMGEKRFTSSAAGRRHAIEFTTVMRVAGEGAHTTFALAAGG